MKKIFILLVFTAVTWGMCASAAEGAPRAVAEEKHHDFGTVYAGGKVFHTFVIANAGDEDLAIKSVSSG